MSPASSASTSSAVRTAPCWGTSSTSGWPSICGCGSRPGDTTTSAARTAERRRRPRAASRRAGPRRPPTAPASRRAGSRWARLARLKASVTGQIALRAEAERLALVRRQRSRHRRSPEKTVRIVTFWPSSRRLAIRPPQERATSSGWGATKMWVMAAEYIEAARRSAQPHPSSPTSGTNTHGPSDDLAPLVAVADDQEQLLLDARPDRDDETAAVSASCSRSGAGIDGAAAVTMIPANGARSGAPRLIRRRRGPRRGRRGRARSSRSRAVSARSACRSIVRTRAPR